MANEPVDLHKQKQQVFLLYTLFLGDAVKTGHALGLPAPAIAAVAKAEGWDARIADITALRNSDKPGDLERALNRAINYVQAHSYRAQIERVIEEIRGWDPDRLRDLLISESTDKVGNVTTHLSCRPFADLASALEKAHMLTYLALNDTAQDRARRKEETDEGVLAATALHTQIAQAMANIPVDSPQSKLLSAQQKLAEDLLDLGEFSKRMTNDTTKKSKEGEEPPLTLEVPPIP
jgi:hypothetical protein